MIKAHPALQSILILLTEPSPVSICCSLFIRALEGIGLAGAEKR